MMCVHSYSIDRQTKNRFYFADSSENWREDPDDGVVATGPATTG